MSIAVSTKDPEVLLAKFIQGIKNGEVKTFLHEKGRFYHVSDPLRKGAYLVATTSAGVLTFNLKFTASTQGTAQDTTYRNYVSGAYHGQCVQVFVTHFRAEILGMKVQ